RHTRSYGDWSSDVCSADLDGAGGGTRSPTVSHLDLNQARLPISPRPRRTPERMGAYSNHGPWSNPARAEIVGWQRRICRAAASEIGRASGREQVHGAVAEA